MAFKRPCLNCGVSTTGSRCPSCSRGHRGTTAERFGSGWTRISRLVLERDHHICHICGLPGATTVDHLVPRAHGGDSSDTDLLAAAHRSCNSRRVAGLA
jgi:5-methylcytosine-specific restriction endonuclease McrA